MNQSKQNLVGAVFQATMFFTTLLCMGLLLTFGYKIFTSYDPIEQLNPNNPSSKSVTVGLHVTHFNKFKVHHNIFEMQGVIWFSYNPHDVSLDTIKKFTIANGQILTISDPKVTTNNNRSIAQFNVHFSFYCSLDYRIFPFDDHRIVINITNDFLPHDLIINSSNQYLTFNKTLYLPGWTLINSLVETGYTTTSFEQDGVIGETKQKAAFAFFCQRNDPSVAINIFLTLMLLLFMSLLTFSSPEDSVLIVSVAMVALVGYRVVMQAMGPEHISYFIFSDYLYLFSLIGSVLALFGGIFTRERNSSLLHKKIAIIAIYTLYIMSSTIITFLL